MTSLPMAPWVFLLGLATSCVLMWGAGPETPPDTPHDNHLPLEAGDDVKKAKWVDINGKIKLYASYSQRIQLVAKKRGALWSEEMYPDFHGWQLGVSCKPKALK